ncbi:MAG: DUF1015 domain-containing protein [Oscillospiraceae bacterium]|nr:DUF1015 domain-containing protein [Oscillospiraceae bacterium]
MSGVPFCPGEILIPKEHLEKWSVVACDQFTSQPDYWKAVEQDVEGYPSSYNLIFPEAYLDTVDFDEKVKSINNTMKQYLREGVFQAYRNSMVYVERTLKSGKIRRGVLGLLDLEEYDYKKGSRSLVRATEATVEDRLPPRVRIRENAFLELPHVLVLIDDPEKKIIEQFEDVKADREKLYDFDLNMDGGHITGYRMKGPDYMKVMHGCDELAKMENFSAKYNLFGRAPLVFAVGDGNHSLAAAKACYEEKKRLGMVDRMSPARYALVEVCNLHEDSLEFEAIHRAVFDVDHKKFLSALQSFCEAQEGRQEAQTFTVLADGKEETITVEHPKHTLAVGTVQDFIDQYIAVNGGRVDYIHGQDVTRDLAAKGAVGILLPPMAKDQLFPTVIQEGALPRKTFSMGEASDKRYYLECRKIR